MAKASKVGNVIETQRIVAQTAYKAAYMSNAIDR